MILTIGDGGSLAFILACIIAFWLYRKDQKEINEIQKKIDKTKANMADYERARDDIHNGAKILKIDDYKHLTKRDIDFYADLHGVRFI